MPQDKILAPGGPITGESMMVYHRKLTKKELQRAMHASLAEARRNRTQQSKQTMKQFKPDPKTLPATGPSEGRNSLGQPQASIMLRKASVIETKASLKQLKSNLKGLNATQVNHGHKPLKHKRGFYGSALDPQKARIRPY
jgi:hypothetical protein